MSLKTSAENAAATLDGTELIRAVQSTANVKATVDQIATRTVAKARTVTAKTAGYTLVTADSGGHFTNTGAAGAVALTLPAAASGLVYSAEVTAAQTFGFTAAGGAKIYVGATGSAANGTATANALKACLTLICDGTDWAALGGAAGTWTVT